MTQTLKLKKYITIQGKLICKTGLRIGGSKEELEIGGLDNPIIRDPVDELPYIPGSSIKGKLRSLLEYKYNRVAPNGNPCGCGKPLDECPVCTIFGPHMKPTHDLGPSRLIVRDCLLSEESRANLARLEKQGLGYSELKTENIIDRRTGTARAGGLRTMERVPKGTEFNLNISVRVFEQDDEAKMVGYVKEALELLQKDYLGGSGTRGYGWVEVQYEVVPD
ncbi:MAG: type III-A CRISPR-associated RAMP protein Csm3 [Dehalococcoidia bacterium CG2_30_46_19]|nr:MAG: type III-A CRISPR-associated RAMP protein Csm3 [Dehalococcoidia bacterium CG2_30_46_19]